MTGEPGVRSFTLTRQDLRCYAEESRDRNPIHLDEEAARTAGLPDVIAHGMLLMGLAATVAGDWTGLPDAAVELSAAFGVPVPVPADGGVEIQFRVKAVSAEQLQVTATCERRRVARFSVVLPPDVSDRTR